MRKRWRRRQKNAELLKERRKENTSDSRSKAAWVRRQKQSGMVGARYGKHRLPFISYIKGWKQKVHSHCLGKKPPDVWVLVLGALAQALLETHTGKHRAEQFLLHTPWSENFWLLDVFNLFLSIPFLNDCLVWMILKIAFSILAILTLGDEVFFPTAAIMVVLLCTQTISFEKRLEVNSISRKLKLCSAQ